jgi:serpin B
MSPISIQSAISLLYFGATGATETELKQGLEYNRIHKNQVAESFSQLSDKIKSTVGLDIANKVFIGNGLSVEPSFNEIARKSFNSETQTVDFQDKTKTARIINKWVESKTNNKIRGLIDKDSLDASMKMMMVNAIYFKGAWVHQFDKIYTTPIHFYLNEQDTVETDFMFLSEYLPYAQLPELSATALELPYKNSDITMVIILPDSKTGLPALETKFSELNFNQLSSRFSTKNEVYVRIRKFKIETNIELAGPLNRLGMRRIFSNNAEFNKLLADSESVKVSQIIHKAFIEVNEEGAEAAAATSLGFSAVSAIPKEKEYFKADHPFLFVLKTNSEILFMGRYVAPNK